MTIRRPWLALLWGACACDGGAFVAGEVKGDSGEDDGPTIAIDNAAEAPDVAGDASVSRPDVPDVVVPDENAGDVLEHDAAPVSVGVSPTLDASADVAGDVLEDARTCLVVTSTVCAVPGYPYPAGCDGYACCCNEP
jgi:hypothetical protein